MPKKPLKIAVHGITYVHIDMDAPRTWAVQDERYMGADGKTWSFDGLNPLKDGDILTIFNDKARREVLWHGKIRLEWKNPNQYGQKGVDLEAWSKIFHEEKPATVILAPAKKARDPYPAKKR